MSDRTRYDSAMFWLAFGTASAVIGLALMTIAVSRSPGSNPLRNPLFDGGLGLLALGGLLLLWALVLYLVRRKGGIETQASQSSKGADDRTAAVKGYFAERRKLIDMWERQQRSRGRKSR